MHLRRRRKGLRWQREEPLRRPVELHGDREQAVVARAGLGNHAVGHLALHHQHGAVERGVACGQLEQDGRGDAVRQVANHQQALAVRRGGRRKVELQHVLLDDGDAGRGVQ